jgi:2-hydroxychromene-2-carboxylate isomerase
MPLPVLDFWFDFASTYSYLAAMRIGPLAQKAEVRVRFRPFLLGPIFKAQGWSTSPFNLYPARGRHMCATSSGHARSCSSRSGVPIPSRRTVCSRPA